MVDSTLLAQTMMETTLKNAMIASPLKSEGKSPRMFYLPYDRTMDRQVLGNKLYGQFVLRMVSLV
jgi:hypothetical protein